MIARLLCLTLLLCHAARAADAPDMKGVHSSEDLARFISSMTTNDAVLGVLLDGLGRSDSIQFATSTNAIPVREVYGTIVEERFRNALGESFYEHGRKYGVREICSFRDARGDVWRFHIVVYEERQYELMRNLLRRELTRREKSQRPTRSLQSTRVGAAGSTVADG